MTTIAYPTALITGATGGMGRAAARRLGQTRSLFVTDINDDRVSAFAEALRDEGFSVAGAMAGDLSVEGVATELVAKARAAGPLASVFHAAGLSPSQAGAEAILRINLIATERLLRALEADLEPGLVTVMVASVAAYQIPVEPQILALIAEPLRDGFMADIVEAMNAQGLAPAVIAYGASKQALLKMAEARCGQWGGVGARIVSVSPGVIDTPMGRLEVESNPMAAAGQQMTPLGWGRSTDIAALAAFLCSEDARFITGCDIRIDGGFTPVARAAIRNFTANS